MPVPLATVIVNFIVSFSVTGDYTLEFTFENESLRHLPGRTIRIAQMESWIDRIYEDKLKVRQMMNLVTKFESTRLIPQPEIDPDEFYAGCYLLESTLGEITYDDELDDTTIELIEIFKVIQTELKLPNGASNSKQKVTRISTFDAIAQVLGVADETPAKRGAGDKTALQKFNDIFKLYGHINEITQKLGDPRIPANSDAYYFDLDDSGQLEKIPYDDSFKRQKKEPNVSTESREDRSTYEVIYKGEMNKKKNVRDGVGILVWPTGFYYEGYFHDDKINGYGRMIHRLGDAYEGDWYENKTHGFGIFYHVNGVKFEGNWVEDQPHGQGTETYLDGTIFEGNYVSGEKEGEGTIIWPNGIKYTGAWKQSLMHGPGLIVWPDGRQYEGEFQQGKIEGRGTFSWPDGRSYTGEYLNNQKQGYGEYFWPDGRIFRGPWKEGRQDGEGYYTSAEGVTRRGLWNLGKRQKWFRE